MPALVPELCVRNFSESLAVYRDVFGFKERYRRKGFAMLDLHAASLMLEQLSPESWLVGPAERPLGRGMNLEISVPALDPIVERAKAGEMAPFRAVEEVWYATDRGFVGQRQVIYADLDGYLLRFAESLGRRKAPPATGRTVP